MQIGSMLAGGLMITLLATGAHADCVKDSTGTLRCGPGQCLPDSFSVRCASVPGGGAAKNAMGTVECGQGLCVVDRVGFVQCAPKPGGSAVKDVGGFVVCLDADANRVRCVRGTVSACREGKSAGPI